MAYVGFDKLKGQLGKKGIKNPGALAASIGRKKYGKGKFQKAAAKGKSMKGMAPKAPAAGGATTASGQLAALGE